MMAPTDLVDSQAPAEASIFDAPPRAIAASRFRGMRNSSADRLIAFDLLRTFAILGMICSHIGPLTARSIGHWQWLRNVEGRAARTFAMLLGTSAVFALASRTRKIGVRRARVEQIVRGILLFIVGIVMTRYPTGVIIVLAVLGVASIFVIPFVNWPPRRAAWTATFLLVVGPPVSYWLRTHWMKQSFGTRLHILGFPSGRSFNSLANFRWFLGDLFITGTYPLITWMPMILIGVALARSDLRSHHVRRTLLTIAIALLLVRFVGVPMIRSLFDLDVKTIAAMKKNIPSEIVLDDARLRGLLTSLAIGSTYPLDWRLLFYAGPHSGTWFEMSGVIGIALVALLLCLVAAERFPKTVRILSSPGRLAFTIYVTHILVRYKLMEHAKFDPGHYPDTAKMLALFLIVTVVLSTLWSVCIGQGPLEWLLRVLSRGPVSLFKRRSD